jgi:hypothetical protein
MAESLPASTEPMDIGVLTQFLYSLHSYNQDLVQYLGDGQKLCHYTTLEGAVGIIGGNDLWLTNSRFSNDNQELNHGYDLVDQILEEMRRSAVADVTRSERLQSLAAPIAVRRSDQVYVCCFCEQNDLLSQWRGYAESGGGVAIEFDPMGFTANTGLDSPHGLMRLWKVFYNPAQQRAIIRACIEYAWPCLNDVDRIRHIVDALQFFMPTFKNNSFSEEQERRLIFTPYPLAFPKPKFRIRRGLVVPYFSLQELSGAAGMPDPNFRLPIKSILIGPSQRQSLNAQGVRLMLDANGYQHVSVSVSEIPFRE